MAAMWAVQFAGGGGDGVRPSGHAFLALLAHAALHRPAYAHDYHGDSKHWPCYVHAVFPLRELVQHSIARPDACACLWQLAGDILRVRHRRIDFEPPQPLVFLQRPVGEGVRPYSLRFTRYRHCARLKACPIAAPVFSSRFPVPHIPAKVPLPFRLRGTRSPYCHTQCLTACRWPLAIACLFP